VSRTSLTLQANAGRSGGVPAGGWGLVRRLGGLEGKMISERTAKQRFGPAGGARWQGSDSAHTWCPDGPAISLSVVTAPIATDSINREDNSSNSVVIISLKSWCQRRSNRRQRWSAHNRTDCLFEYPRSGCQAARRQAEAKLFGEFTPHATLPWRSHKHGTNHIDQRQRHWRNR
jgi:hypothetical protein